MGILRGALERVATEAAPANSGLQERDMVRMALTALAMAAVLGAATPVAVAQGTADNEDGRYTFSRADEGYLRLDGRTGQVSLCTRRPVGWACQAVPDERTALEAEITRLQTENVVLKKELLARNLPLPGVVKPDTPVVKNDEPVLQLPGDAEINKVVVFVEKVWKRLVEMVASLQRDVLRRS